MIISIEEYNRRIKRVLISEEEIQSAIKEAAKKIDMSNISDYDQGLNEAFQQTFHEYFEGNVDMDTALENFYTSAVEKYPELTK